MFHQRADNITGGNITVRKPGIHCAGGIFLQIFCKNLISFLVLGGFMLVAGQDFFDLQPTRIQPCLQTCQLVVTIEGTGRPQIPHTHPACAVKMTRHLGTAFFGADDNVFMPNHLIQADHWD